MRENEKDSFDDKKPEKIDNKNNMLQFSKEEQEEVIC